MADSLLALAALAIILMLVISSKESEVRVQEQLERTFHEMQEER